MFKRIFSRTGTRWIIAGVIIFLGGGLFLIDQGRRHDIQTPATRQQTEHLPVTPAVSDGNSSQAFAMVSRPKQQLIGVKTAVVEKHPLDTTIRAVGRVDYDEQRIAHVNLRISGWVDDLFVDYTGQVVRKGQPLFSLYSPELLSTQDEYLLALRTQQKLKDSPLPEVHQQAEDLVQASRERLRLWAAVQRFQNYQAIDGFGAIASINIPFSFWTKRKYDAGVREATAVASAARADYQAWQNLTRFQLTELIAKVRAQQQVADLYRTTILPQAEQNLEASRAGYRTGRNNFLDVIEAERALLEFRLAFYRALVERDIQLALVEQIVGTLL